jgi:nucleoside-diphosphate-sugar epimerase
VFLSYLGASKTSNNPYLQTKARAEEILRANSREAVILRCSHIVGTPAAPGPFVRSLLPDKSGRIRVLGSGENRIAPLLLDDVVTALLAAAFKGPAGTFDLCGPEVMTVNELCALVNEGRTGTIKHVSPWLARLFSHVSPRLSPAMVDILVSDSVGDPSVTLRAFDLAPGSVRAAWQAEGEPATVAAKRA